MNIIVPSLGRAGTAPSMKWLPEACRQITFAVHKDEAKAYRASYPKCEVMVLSDKCRRHAGLVRAEIMRKVRKPFFFVDDDIRLSLKSASSVAMVFDTLASHMASGASIAGLGQQLFSNYAMQGADKVRGDLVTRNKFVATVYGIQPRDFDDCPLEKLPVYEDVALVIHAARKGGALTSYCATHSNVSPPTGGCNSWRKEKVTVACLKELVRLYPDVCSIRETKMTTHSQHIGIGLRVSWSKL